MASNEEYDLTFTGYLNDYQNAVSLCGLYYITKYVEKVNMEEVIPEFYLDAAKVDGSIYDIPNKQIISNPPAIYITAEGVQKSSANIKGISYKR